MVVYSITDLENLTGIKAHTLRIWEKRHCIIEPKRTDSNIRYYLEEDLKRVMSIALLNQNGYKISRIACMSNVQIQSLAAKFVNVDTSFENPLDGLTHSALRLNEEKFMKIFNANIVQLGFVDTMRNVIYPLLDKLSMMRMTECVEPVNDTFVAQLIKRKCFSEIDKLDFKPLSSETFLLFLLKNEVGEIGLLFIYYLIKSKGFRVMYLGTGMELDHIVRACDLFSPCYFFTIIDEPHSPKEYTAQVRQLSELQKECQVLLTGAQTLKQKIVYPDNVKPFQSTENVADFLDNLVN